MVLLKNFLYGHMIGSIYFIHSCSKWLGAGFKKQSLVILHNELYPGVWGQVGPVCASRAGFVKDTQGNQTFQFHVKYPCNDNNCFKFVFQHVVYLNIKGVFPVGPSQPTYHKWFLAQLWCCWDYTGNACGLCGEGPWHMEILVPLPTKDQCVTSRWYPSFVQSCTWTRCKNHTAPIWSLPCRCSLHLWKKTPSF